MTFSDLKIAIKIFFSYRVRKKAIKIALIVGLILAFINHGNELLTLSISGDTWIRMILTFFVPYTVSSLTATQVILTDLESKR